MRIFVENLQLLAHHGVFLEERTEGRLFRFDMEAELARWATDDELMHTVDYRRLVTIITDVVRGDSVHLIETLAWRIVDEAFSTMTTATSLSLTIRKRATGIDGDPEWVGASFDVDKAEWRRRRENA